MSFSKLFSLLNLKIGGRIFAGCFIIVALLVGAVGFTVYSVDGAKSESDRIVQLRVPTSAASQAMVNDINASLAALRGWMLTGNDIFRKERRGVWAHIAKVRTDMDTMSKNWTNPANVKVWSEFKTILDEFQVAQEKTEKIANSPEQNPATVILVNEAAPRAGKMVGNITKMINLEGAAADSGNEFERKKLLGMMADVRGTLGLSIANIRAYLLTGDAKFRAKFDKLWAKNTKRFGDLNANKSSLSPAQRKAFNEFSKMHGEFAPLPPKMFDIRGSKKWNMANYTLVKEAAPRAGKLLTILSGAKDEAGLRSGGMVDNQKKLLNSDAVTLASHLTQLEYTLMILLAMGVALGTVVSIFTARSIVRPVQDMTGAMSQLANNNLETEVPALDKKDEIGDMAKAVQVFKESMIRTKEMEAEQAKSREAQQKRAEAIEKRTRDFDEVVSAALSSVTTASSQMQSSSESMSSVAEETNAQSSAVAAAAEEASTNVQTVAATTEELSASISEIGQQVNMSLEAAANAVKEVTQASENVGGLASSAQNIGEVVSMITDIAEQTNLLALNATIEAARAGEAGKGFAVVANEVKELASQTAKATEEISSQIEGIQSATEGTVGAIDSIGKVIAELNDGASAIAAAVEEQGTATQEIARNVSEAAAGTSEVTSNISDVTTAAARTGETSGEVLQAARELSGQAETLRKEVDSFLKDIKAA